MADQNIQPNNIPSSTGENNTLSKVFMLKMPAYNVAKSFGVIEQKVIPLRAVITNDPIWATRWTAGLCRYLSSSKFYYNSSDNDLAAAACVQSFAFSTPSLYTEFILPYTIDRKYFIKAGYSMTDQLFRNL